MSILVAVVPSFSVGVLLHNMLQSTLEEKVEQKFMDSANIIEREISLWLKERVYDLNVFSNSSILAGVVPASQNNDGAAGVTGSVPGGEIETVETYLTTLKNQFDDYLSIFVLSRTGSVIAASQTGDADRSFSFPDDAVVQISDRQWFKGGVLLHSGDAPSLLIGIPLFMDQLYEYESLLAIEVSLAGLKPLLEPERLGAKSGDRLYESLVELEGGRQFLFSNDGADILGGIQLLLGDLNMDEGDRPVLQELSNGQNMRLMGLLVPFQELEWGLLIAEDYEEVFASAIESRNRNIIIVCSLGLVMGLAAYLLTRQIMVPLTALIQGSRKVAGGDLDVQLSVRRNDEIGFATRVFNEMVEKLKESQTALEQLATTDALTGLDNRKQIMQKLQDHFDYYQRYKTGFSVLMLDVDHFKSVNDTCGHQAGDEVLRQIALIFQDNLRNVDAAGRYGGEEFLVILAESAEEESLHAAERIRKAVANHIFCHEDTVIRLHVSIGVSRIMEQDEDENAVVKRSDRALYRAKKGGRNQVVYLVAEEDAPVGRSENVVALQTSVKK
ncbi:diguanylate cyclase [Desulfopila sp. IMCC35008]|uniref:sensor domain-containing diguanylate cyclase n=1 Tax=Desulfopila sp. IMCC35008 TaxID=2653858 RepID=UPI001F0D9A63|nr:diguanylate cyclase [Desulfopila sp. IMCC35008]